MLVLCSGALVFSAAGCVGNSDPVQSPSVQPTPTRSASGPPPSASPTAKPTPTPIPGSSKGPAKNWPVPKMPEAAKEKSIEGLKAFVPYYYELLAYTLNTDDSKPVRKVTHADCDVCFEEFINTADGNKVAGSWITGADFETSITRAIVDGKSGVVLFTLMQGQMLVYSSTGTQYASFEASSKPLPGSMLLLYDNGWKVQSIETEEES
ncbi:DUF6318 family protein [Arthrobacter sp. MYb227]|uniref:DUF6318 family protein n=1 Tax=Arthrobacter sp. MYb227 TaxID=1848601 RepID=UPI0021579B03|nr:DUF6318 family protein [Arthrobacter sp. MYb227]